MADQQGSITSATDAAGSTLFVDTYDEYGIPGSSNQGRFQYTGQMYLPEVGVYHFKARAYSATLGRFLQADPIGYDGGMNLYAYVGGDPVNLSDPFGLCPGQGTRTPCTGGQDPDSGDGGVVVTPPTCDWERSMGKAASARCPGNDDPVVVSLDSRWWNAIAVGVTKYIILSADTHDNACNNTAAVSFVKSIAPLVNSTAASLNTPTSNIVGLSARETGYGTGTFVSGGAYFNMETRVGRSGAYPTFRYPFSNGWQQASGDNRVFVASYPSFSASLSSFAATYGNAVRGIQDPTAFLTALKNAGFNNYSGFTNPSVLNMAARRMNCP